MKAALIISHGSRSYKTKEEVQLLIKSLVSLTTIPIIRYAFLEIESPSIPDGVKDCVQKGASEIIVLLNFLNAGRHVDVDIPRIIAELKLQYPAVTMTITPPIGQHPFIPKLFADVLERYPLL